MNDKKLVMPKGDGRLDLAIQSLKIYYEINTWVENPLFIDKFIQENNEYDENTDRAMILHKARTARYFGLIEYLFKSRGKLKGRQAKITERGKRFYEAYKTDNKLALIDTIMDAIKNETFGRNNYATSESDSNVEPPRVLIKAAYELKYLTKSEFINLMFGMHNLGLEYAVIIEEITKSRKENIEPSLLGQLPKHEKESIINVYGDWKFIQLLREVGVLENYTDKAVLSDIVINKYAKFIEDLSLTTEDISKNIESSDKSLRLKTGKNILLYGVPGSGKSYTIKNNYIDDQERMERVVFHPDYMNSDFVGQILPTVKDEIITYEFTPGPFTRIMKKAYNNPTQEYYLIIEEINRGNAPGIFGELFQLLDREEGTSTYSISNEYVSREVYGDENIPVKLPSNLWILATMNTSDQNVFTLDTAFQRRWNMKMIANDVSKSSIANLQILDTGVTWERFNTIINDRILTSNENTLSSEDKRLGSYFVNEEVLLDKDETVFAEKVLKYLWDDAFKFGRDKLFNKDIKSLEEIIKTFVNNSGQNRLNIFTVEIKTLLIANNVVQEENDGQ